MTSRARILTTLTVALLSGCGPAIRYTHIATPARAMPPRTPESVAVFTRFSLPTQPYLAVGIIETTNSGFQPNDPGYALDLVRQDAARRGCDAIVVEMNGDVQSASSTYSTGAGTYSTTRDATRRGFSGVCVVFQ